MFSDMRDWFGFAVSVVSFLLSLSGKMVRPRRRRRVRYRHVEWGKLKWTTYDREDDDRS